MRHSNLFLLFILIAQIHAQRADFSTINFAQADMIAERYEGEELKNLPLLTYHLTSQLETDVERFRAIYYWVTHNIKGNDYLTNKSVAKRKKLWNDTVALQQWNRQFKQKVLLQLVEDKETLCSGYAYLIQKLAKLAGIESKIINGYGIADGSRSKDTSIANHSWNAVKLNSKWYLCDATWSAGYTESLSKVFEFEYDDSYFLLEPAEFNKTHKPTENEKL